jgi:hypothetical protein
MYEIHLPATGEDSHSLLRVGWSHCKGEFWGLAVHPLRDEFATCGSDRYFFRVRFSVRVSISYIRCTNSYPSSS